MRWHAAAIRASSSTRRSRRNGSPPRPPGRKRCASLKPFWPWRFQLKVAWKRGSRRVDRRNDAVSDAAGGDDMAADAEFMFDPRGETLSRDALAGLQLERLRATLARAYDRVPHYRQRLDAVGAAPADLKHLEQIENLPFTTKDDLRLRFPFGLFAVPRERLARLHASSGTTGKPTVVGYTAADIALWSDLMARSLACAGVRPGDIVHNAYGYGLFTGGLGAHYGAERLGCTVVPMSGGATERQVTLLQDFGANVLCATPSYALNIAEVAAAMNVDLRRSSLRIGVFGAEPWSESMRRVLEDQLGIKAVDLYGLSEILGPGVASECGMVQAGLHGWEDHFLLEVIDAESLARSPVGESG